MMDPHPPTVRVVSECFIKPKYATEESKKPYYLTAWDLAMLSAHYIQKGLLFKKPVTVPHNQQDYFVNSFLDRLKQSLSLTLVHFYPLSGRLVTQKNENPQSYFVFVDCNNSPGAKFIHAILNMTISDILSPIDVPQVVQSFFYHDRAVNHDGHTMPLLTIQVTELVDGIFIGCSMNHCIADGTSYWHFFNMWSEIFQLAQVFDNNDLPISRPPLLTPWFPDGHGPILNLPFKHHDEFISRYEAPELRERIFHFSAETIAKLKAKANSESNTNKISSFQSLSALVWRCITRARRLPNNQTTTCKLAADNRTRLEPPLSPDYFGNSHYPVAAEAKAGELLQNNIGWAAWKLNTAVTELKDKVVREVLEAWPKSPFVYQLGRFFNPYTVMMGSSPRFSMYGNEFGLGKAVAIRCGYANKFNGKVTSIPGYEGGGSIDLEVCLPPYAMNALESDEEFMSHASESHMLH
ncbi:HXXXD-type acyl-transferase family protein [Quillaja saponaria]|uniref:HXXXD-type acyl-transferase family protein n=1 Tax=Quillaja saponaria TaxID=32244 RepID=A0AAD7PJS1_QUISA|nr:HXXXD-type acyl-transferase family protein [Quillaja saponaria]